VADGSADASVSLTAKRDWDLAAADIILHEAGGLLTDARGAALIYNRPVTTQTSLLPPTPSSTAKSSGCCDNKRIERRRPVGLE